MPIPVIRVVNAATEEERLVCVVDGQAYYCSTGKNSGMSGLWLPFEGVDVGIFSKPEAGNSSSASFQSVFPPELREAIARLDRPGMSANIPKCNKDHWGRFKNMECLYVSCLLTGREQPQYVELYRAMQDYLKDNNLPSGECLLVSRCPADQDIVMSTNTEWKYALYRWLNTQKPKTLFFETEEEDNAVMEQLLLKSNAAAQRQQLGDDVNENENENENESKSESEFESETKLSVGVVEDYPEIMTQDLKRYIVDFRIKYESDLQPAPAVTIVDQSSRSPMHAPPAYQRRGVINQEASPAQAQRSSQRSSCLSSIARVLGFGPRDATIRQETSSAGSQRVWRLRSFRLLSCFSRRRGESEAGSTTHRL